MNEAVLFVDDEENVLKALARGFSDRDLRILQTTSPLAALELFKHEEIAVVVSDNMMPEMRGIELLARIKDYSPDTVKILMTAYADLTTALEAINTGEVHRFVVKPWDIDELVTLVEQSLHRYRVLMGLRREDETVLRSLAQTIELKDPYTKGHCDRVASYALLIADSLELPANLKKEIRYGSWLHDCGKIGVPESILNFNGLLTTSDFDTVKKHPAWGADVARQARLSQTIVNIVLYHHERFDGTGYPEGLAGESIPLEARIVAVADVFDALTTVRPYKQAFPRQKAIDLITTMQGTILDPNIVDVFIRNLSGCTVAELS